MKARYWIVITMVVALSGLAAGYWLARRTGFAAGMTPEPAMDARKVLYWYDPMVPNQHFDKPGKSPFMDMQLMPKYAEDAAASDSKDGVKIDAGILQNLGLRLTTVQRGVVAQPITAVGTLMFNQRDVAVVQARANGFVTRIYQHAPGDVIAQNAALADLLVPEWSGAQTEFLALLSSTDISLIDAARQRLLLLGMSEELIERIERSRQPQTTWTLTTPIAGMIELLEVRAGMTLSAGATLAKINGLKTVWLEVAIPEAQSGLLSTGKRVTAQLTAYPGETFSGQIVAILPEANAESRTIRARIELPNSNGRLRPGMFAQARIESGKTEPVLWIPTEAVIRSGTRNVVMVATDNNRFEPAEVQIGSDAQGKTLILSGLQEGQKIVASGQFLIDSEASLQGVLGRLSSTP